MCVFTPLPLFLSPPHPSGNICLAFSLSLSLTRLVMQSYSLSHTHTYTHTCAYAHGGATPVCICSSLSLSGCLEERQQRPWCSGSVTSTYFVSLPLSHCVTCSPAASHGDSITSFHCLDLPGMPLSTREDLDVEREGRQ